MAIALKTVLSSERSQCNTVRQPEHLPFNQRIFLKCDRLGVYYVLHPNENCYKNLCY
ncbi:MAG: hypothetical protein ACYTXA_04455 [Nostoc sp.]